MTTETLQKQEITNNTETEETDSWNGPTRIGILLLGFAWLVIVGASWGP